MIVECGTSDKVQLGSLIHEEELELGTTIFFLNYSLICLLGYFVIISTLKILEFSLVD